MLAIDFDKRKLSSLNIDFIAANRFRVSKSTVSTRIHSLKVAMPKARNASQAIETRRVGLGATPRRDSLVYALSLVLNNRAGGVHVDCKLRSVPT
jgi:hypothetical protein